MPPTTTSRLNRLEPITWPTTMSPWPRRAATIAAATSGNAVPIATGIRPVSSGAMPSAAPSDRRVADHQLRAVSTAAPRAMHEAQQVEPRSLRVRGVAGQIRRALPALRCGCARARRRPPRRTRAAAPCPRSATARRPARSRSPRRWPAMKHSSSGRSARQRTSSGAASAASAQGQAEVDDVAADRVAQRQRLAADPDRARVDRQFRQRGAERDQQQAGGERRQRRGAAPAPRRP